jgi:peptide/nickel transport system substrate-binding protein
MPTRRRVLQAASALAIPSIARGQGAQVLTVVPQADLASLDPVWTTAYQTRDHGFLVFDTLFGIDTRFRSSPQMAEGAVSEDGGRVWRIVLRDGLTFHDGSRVLARDAVVSIRRWGGRDAFGQSLLEATDEITAPDDKAIVIRLKRAFPLLPDALAKASPSMCPIMPERLAVTDPFTQVTEMVGSGPYRYKADERVPGDRVVYERNPAYIPRSDGAADGTAGPKVAHFDRVEWRLISDPQTVAAALRQQEIDWWLSPDPDLLPLLRHSSGLVVEPLSSTGYISTLRFNHLQPPFDNPAIRRSVLGAVSQADYMIGMVGTDPKLWRDGVGYFCPDTAMASDAGMAALMGPRDLQAAHKALVDAGYRGETVVVLTPTDIAAARALAEITADMLRKIGMTVETPTMDWATMVQRRVKTDPPAEGGWSIFHTGWSGLDMINPAGHIFLRANGRAAAPGWPTSPAIEALREEWFSASDLPSQQAICRRIQLQAFADVPYIPLGQYFGHVAYQSNLTGILKGSPLFWNVKRT